MGLRDFPWSGLRARKGLPESTLGDQGGATERATQTESGLAGRLRLLSFPMGVNLEKTILVISVPDDDTAGNLAFYMVFQWNGCIGNKSLRYQAKTLNYILTNMIKSVHPRLQHGAWSRNLGHTYLAISALCVQLELPNLNRRVPPLFVEGRNEVLLSRAASQGVGWQDLLRNLDRDWSASLAFMFHVRPPPPRWIFRVDQGVNWRVFSILVN